MRLTLTLLAASITAGCSAVGKAGAPVPTPDVSLVAHACSNTQYGHYPYQQASQKVLQPIGGVYLHQEAAKAFKQMSDQAKSEGVRLIPLSGFRSIQDQTYLFYEIARQRHQSPVQRAKVSAPPGFSEHHTGYAVDLNSLKQSFASTREYQWLDKHAQQYGFELSFPANNAQGITFEPWHWRFVNTPHARKIFSCLAKK